jgi:hypothetical protein
VESAGVLCLNFSTADDDQDITRSLAIAFDRVWEGYYRARRVTVSQAVARSELARRLVHLSREGVRDEDTLTKVGLNHLLQFAAHETRNDISTLRIYAKPLAMVARWPGASAYPYVVSP